MAPRLNSCTTPFCCKTFKMRPVIAGWLGSTKRSGTRTAATLLRSPVAGSKSGSDRLSGSSDRTPDLGNYK